MRLNTDLNIAIKCVGSLAQSILFKVPFLVTGCVSLLIASQLSKMAAFLIPLKALFVASADKLPDYLLFVVGDTGREAVVFGLTLIAIGLYFFHLIIDLFRGHLEQLAVKRMLMSGRVSLVESSSKRVRKAFEDVVSVLSAAVFSLTIFIALAALVDGLVGFLGFYFVVMILVYTLYYQKTRLEAAELTKRLPFHVGVISALGFLSGFALILLQVLSGELASVIVAVMALILLRLLMNQVISAFRSGLALNSGYTIYDHLLSGSALTSKESADEELIALLGSGALSLPMIWTATGVAPKNNGFHWLDCSVKGIAKARLDLDSGAVATLKIYAKSAELAAEREQLILRELGPSGFCADVLAEHCIDGHHIRVLNHARSLDAGTVEFQQARSAFLSELMAFEPTAQLLGLSTTVNQPIHRRLDVVQIVSLLIESQSLPQSLGSLCMKWPKVQNQLDNSPLQLVVRAASETIGVLESRSVVCSHWENWSIEPIGAVWGGAGLPASMQVILDSARKSRPKLNGMVVEQLLIVHALCRLEAGKNKLSLAMCVDMILQLDELVDALNAHEVAA